MSALRQHIVNSMSSKRLATASVCVGIVWLACLPAISIVTGELKPRSVFFDETTMSPMAARATIATSHWFQHEVTVLQSVLQSQVASDVACARAACERHRDGFTQFVVRPKCGAATLEAIALVVFDNDKTAAAMAFAIAEGLSKVDWLAKAILVVVGDAKAFVEAYHSTRDMARAGILRAAFVLEHGAKLRLRIIGANAALPNMDFVHLISTGLRMDVAVEGTRVDNTYWDRASGLINWLGHYMTGPTGEHAVFINYGIDAVTVRGPSPTIAVALELAIRALNTVEHELHHSFFMYWLASPATFVSVDEYAWPLMLLVLPYAIAAHRVLSDADSLQNLFALVVTLVALPVAVFSVQLRLWRPRIAYFLVVLLLCGLRHRFPFGANSSLVLGILSLCWAYFHAALVLGQPALCLLGTLAAMPLLCGFAIKALRHTALWWWLLLGGVVHSVLKPSSLDRLRQDSDNWQDTFRLYYLFCCVLPMHAVTGVQLLCTSWGNVRDLLTRDEGDHVKPKEQRVCRASVRGTHSVVRSDAQERGDE